MSVVAQRTIGIPTFVEAVPVEIIHALGGHAPSEQQWAAIGAPMEPGVLIAGAGSGKTAVMAARFVYLAINDLAHPREMLGLTFTNKAAASLAERVRRALEPLGLAPSDEPTVMTYHAFASKIIADYGLRAGVGADAQLITRGQARQLAGAIYGNRTFEHMEVRTDYHLDWVLDLADACADHLVTPLEAIAEDRRWIERLETAKGNGERISRWVLATPSKRIELLEVVAAYREAKAARGLIDYGDQIAIAHEIVQDQAVVADFHSRYRTALLDEYQDTNVAQARMLRALMPDGYPVMAVGDPDQNIYGWRGASLHNLLAFPEQFRTADGEPATVRPLTVNFRSGARILHAADAVIGQIRPGERFAEKALLPLPARGEGEVCAFLATDELTEAETIAAEAARAHAGGVPWSEMAILPRKKRLFASLMTAFAEADIPVEIVGLGALLRMPEVVDVVALLRVLNDPLDNASFARLALGPRWRLGIRDLAQVSRHAAARNATLRTDLQLDDMPGDVAFSLAETLGDLDEIATLGDDARARLVDLRGVLAGLRARTHEPLVDLLSASIDALGILRELDASPSRAAPAARRNLANLIDRIASFRPLDGEPTLAALIDWLDSIGDANEEFDAAQPTEDDSVKIMTIHQAKGLEFELVFVPGLAATKYSRLFPDTGRQANPVSSPHYLPFELRGDRDVLPRFNGVLASFKRDLDARALEDERRLFYVALTRAKNRVVCSAAWWYNPSGMGESLKNPLGPSAFFDEVRAFPGVVMLGEVDLPEVNPLLARRARRAATWPPPARRPADPQFPDGLAAAVRARRAVTPTDDALFPQEEATPSGRGRALPVTGVVQYSTCPKKFYWTYERPLPRLTGAAARIGTEVHAWIEQRAKGQLSLYDPDEFVGEAERTDGIDPARITTLKKTYGESRFAPLTPSRTEQPFSLVLGDVVVSGKIDAVFENPDGSWEIVDWKTGRAPQEIGDMRWQLECYALAAQEIWGLDPSRLRLTFAYFGGDAPEERDIPARAAAEIRADLAEMLAQITAAEFTPTPGPACGRCDFLRYCEPGRDQMSHASP